MATVAEISGQDFNLAPGLKLKALTVTMDGSYAKTAGETVDVSSYFPTKVYGALPITATDGWMLSYELGTSGAPATGKIVARWTTSTLDGALFPEVDSATDLTGVAGVFLFLGY